MTRGYLQHLPALLLVAVLSAFAWWGAPDVPFHPDESTQLFMSADFETLCTNPAALGWNAQQDTPRQRYRLLDAPLTRYLLGLGRTLSAQPALPVDWDWGKTWQENAAALPSAALLQAGRGAVTLLLPFTLLLLYFTGCALGGRRVGLAALLLLGLHPLVLLHARRAMAEGALLFGVSFTLWALLAAPRSHRAWVLGLALALAVNAKQSALALLPLLLTGHSASPSRRSRRWQPVLSLSILLGVSVLLNPVFWPHPLAAMRNAIQLRADLTARQSADTARLAPNALLDTPAKRLIALLGNVYITPPQFAEVGNYRAETAQAESVYLSQWLHNWGRGLWGGAFFLALTLWGIGRGVRQALRGWKTSPESAAAHKVILLLAATVLQGGALLGVISLPWQRYVIPLLPMVVLWQAYALKALQSKQP